MKGIDYVVLGRIGSRMLLAVVVTFGLLAMAESLDSTRFTYLADIGGPQLALLALAVSATRWTIRSLAVIVLIGAIVGLLDLQARHEMTVIKSSGHSIWRVLRTPALVLFLFGVVIALVVETYATQIDRAVNPNVARDTGAITASGSLWLEEGAQGVSYILVADQVQPGNTTLNGVTIFAREGLDYPRIVAAEARLEGRQWVLPFATAFRADRSPVVLTDLALPTATTPEALRVRLTSTDDLTFFELATAVMSGLNDPLLQNAVTTRFLRLISLPVMLVGSLLIAFAFTAGYRRTNKYGATVLYGIVLGFVVFLVTEMADRAGSAGVLDPAIAAVGPAFVAVVIGVTVLLYREDGRV
jgi:lipopolysaccharide export system permease protein